MAKKETKKKETKKKVATDKKEPKSKSNDAKDSNVQDKVKAIRLSLLKSFGDNAVIEGSDLEKANFGRISTGSLKLDVELGGGIPIGRITQIAGNKSDGKSTLTDIIASNAQKQTVKWTWTRRHNEKGRELVEEIPKEVNSLVVGFLDAEGHKSIDWSRDVLGVDTDNWIYTQPSGAEEAFDIAHQMQLDGVNLIVLDSIDSIVPTKIYEKDFGDSAQMGIKAKLIGDFLRKFTMTNNKLFREGKLPCTLILINQVREKIGAYGDPLFTPGGKALDFYSSVDLRLRRGDWITEGTGDNKVIVGQVIKFKTHKNKTYKQQRSGEFDFYFDSTSDEKHLIGSIDNFKSTIILGAEYGVIERAGAWFRYKGENLAQGAENTITYLKHNMDKYEAIKEELFHIILEEGE